MINKKTLISALFIVIILASIFGLKKLQARRTEIMQNTAWEVFKNYLEAAKDKDLNSLKNYSYALSDTCLDNKKKKECEELMSNAYFFGAGIERASLTHTLYDNKNVILLGDYKETVSNGVVSVARPVIYFVRDGKSVKLLSFNPFQGSFLVIGESSTSTAMTKVYAAVQDSDGDTISDMTEECRDFIQTEGCEKTDISKRDSDGDGFWDSTQSLFK